jgi:hypothetical protein
MSLNLLRRKAAVLAALPPPRDPQRTTQRPAGERSLSSKE